MSATDDYPIIQIPDDAPESREEAGTKAEFWFRHTLDGVPTLGVFKKRRRPDSGGDAAERVACEVARLIGLPTAAYDLAQFGETMGVVSWTFIDPEHEALTLGNEVLASRIGDYPLTHSARQDRGVRGHTVERVMSAAAAVAPPTTTQRASWIRDGADAMTGYLLLDAWIANTDRHHKNWGWIEDRPSGERRLAPTFDHDASLGHELRDAARTRQLADTSDAPRLSRYARRGKSEFWSGGPQSRQLSPISAFSQAAALRPAAARGWARRLARVTDDQVDRIVDRVPRARMSEPASLFCRTLLGTTRGLILSAVDQLS